MNHGHAGSGLSTSSERGLSSPLPDQQRSFLSVCLVLSSVPQRDCTLFVVRDDPETQNREAGGSQRAS